MICRLQVWQNKTPRDRLHIDYDRGIKEVLTPYANMEDHDHSVVALNELVSVIEVEHAKSADSQ